MWALWAFLSAVLLGFYDISKKTVLRNNAVIPVLCLNTLFSSLIFLPFIILSVQGVLSETSMFFTASYGWEEHRFILLKSVIVMLSWICGYYGIKNLPLTIVGPINATRPVMVLIGALLFLGEHLNIWQWIGVIVAITSFYMLSRSGKKEGIDFRHNKWIALIILSNLLGAISALFDRWLLDPTGMAINKMALQAWYNIYQFGMLGTFLLLRGVQGFKGSNGVQGEFKGSRVQEFKGSRVQEFKGSKSQTFHWDWRIICISVFLSAADFIYFYALTDETAMVSIVSMIRRSSVVVSFLFAAMVLREKNLRSKAVDLGLVIVSLLFLFYGSLSAKMPPNIRPLNSPSNSREVYALLERIDDGASKKFTLEIANSQQPTANSQKDFFELSQDGKRIKVRGSNAVSVATGVNWYLKYYCNIHLCWNQMKAHIPDELPCIEGTERHETDLLLRYYLNYCTFSYSMAYWDWERWEREIDWMALHGINMPLAAVGNECVWRNLLLKRGYTEEEIGAFIPGPSFLAWWEMNNLEGWGGPLPKSWYAEQEQLQKKILKRMRKLGMHPVLPGYSGMVPSRECEVKTYWCGDFIRPGMLTPDDPRFGEFATLYYEEMERLYGKADYYSADPFHEAWGLPENFDIGKAGQGVLDYIKRHGNPGAKWVIQGWGQNPRREMLQALPKDDVLILDLFAENQPQYDYGGYNWCYCMLLNFGGNVGLHGRLEALVNNFYYGREHYAETMKGIGLTMEGIENNPVMYELATELPWFSTLTSNLSTLTWLKAYITYRYGKYDDKVFEAWRLLAEGVYNCPVNGQQGTTESIFCARPSMEAWQVSAWSEMQDYYDPQTVIRAAELMNEATGEFEGCDNYQYDLVDITRQSIAEQGRMAYKHLQDAYRKGSSRGVQEEFKRSSRGVQEFKSSRDECVGYVQEFLSLLLKQDSLLSTRPEFCLDTYLAQAKRKLAGISGISGTSGTSDQLIQQNLLTQITTWAREGSDLNDYAHKEWSGLLRDYYYIRWKEYLDEKLR